jgi:uroporphyrinogen decarboxylase
MTLTHKERLRRALSYEPVDRPPTQINYTASMGEKMAVHFQIPAQELPAFLDNHLIRVDLSYPARESEDGSIRYDWWGAGHAAGEEGYFIPYNPLAGVQDLDSYPWPDPHAPDLMDEARSMIASCGEEYFIAPNLGFALFERAWSLRGFENIFLDLALDSGYLGELLDRITEIQLVLIQRFLELGVDGGYFGDDYGAQKDMLFSPAAWRKLIKPRLARLFTPFRAHGLPVIMHSDGQIQKILPDLVEIGLTALNPVQPEVLDHAWLYSSFSGRLAFYGGISTQTVLPYGQPQEVIAAVESCLRALAPEGTGLLLAPSHRMMTDIPLSNVEALLEAFRGI